MRNSKLKNLREINGLTQEALAEAVGVSRQTINEIENGSANPRLSLCIKICKKLSVTLNDLFWF